MDLLPVPVAPAELLELEQNLADAHEFALSEKSDATRLAYSSDARHFGAWCHRHGLTPLPATVDTAAAYFASLAREGLKAATIDRRAAAVAYAHRLKRLESPTTAEPVRRVLRGIKNRLGVAVDRKSPATAQAVAKMLRKIPDTLTGKRDRALILLGFAAALRRSELVALDVADLERASEGVLVHIRRSKTDQAGEGHVVAVPRGGKLKPCAALEDWLAAVPPAGPVFRRIRKGGALGERLTGQSVALIVKQYAGAAGLDADLFAGHSLRAGFVTSALEAGADLLKVMDVTRHREVSTLKTYDRRAKAFANHAGKGFL